MTIEIDEREFHIASDSPYNSDAQADGNVDVTTSMHHGSTAVRGSNEPMNTESWFNGMRPEWVVINGRPVSFGSHPDRQALSNISNVSSVEHLYITGEHGRISFTATEDAMFVDTENDKSDDPDHWVAEADD